LYKKSQASITEKDSVLERLHNELDNAQKDLSTFEVCAKNKAILEKGILYGPNIRFDNH
jgi:hypothetical protein